LFVGNLLGFKRVDLLLKAFSKLQNNNCRIKIIGGGFEENRLKELAKELKIDNQVDFVGHVTSREELAREYNQAWCSVISSDSGESFSLVAIESLACGCPAVVSDIAGVRGRVINNKTGLIFKSSSVDELKIKIEKWKS